jgi:DNA-directed RNA polymerase subunit K/omega
MRERRRSSHKGVRVREIQIESETVIWFRVHEIDNEREIALCEIEREKLRLRMKLRKVILFRYTVDFV